jgi:type I restriction enzyme S subunit
MSWPRVRLAEIVSLKTGKLDSNAAIQDGEYPFFTCSQQTLRINEPAFDTEAVLLGGNNAAGIFPLKYYKGQFNAYQRTYVIEPLDPNVLNIRFLFYALRPALTHFQSASIGAATQYLTKGILDNFRVPIPSIAEQDHIASILSPYDDLIENNRRRIQLLEQAAHLLYKEWFVYLRFSGHEHVKIKDGVPEGWVRKRIEDVCETVGGGTPSTKISGYWEGGEITWVVPTDVTRNDCLVLLDSEKKITEAGLKSSSARIVPPNTILMTSRASVGFFALLDKEACTNQGFINIIPKEHWFRMYLLHNLMFRVEEIRSRAGGTTYKEINKGRFRQMPIIVPAKSVTWEFEELAYQIIRQIRVLKKQQMKLMAARGILLPRLMNGEIAV